MTTTNSTSAAATCICDPNGDCIDGAVTGPNGEVCATCNNRALGAPCLNGANDDPDGEDFGS